MLKKFNNLMTSSIIFSILLTIFGITLILIPKTYITVMSIMIAILLILYGIMLLALDYKSNIFIDNITSGILIIILGIILLLYPTIISTIIPICLGIWFISSSVSKIRLSILLKEENNKWIVALILSILSIICGFILIINPFKSAIALTKVLGIVLIIYSVIDMINMIIFKKNVNDIIKHIKKTFKEID